MLKFSCCCFDSLESFIRRKFFCRLHYNKTFLLSPKWTVDLKNQATMILCQNFFQKIITSSFDFMFWRRSIIWRHVTIFKRKIEWVRQFSQDAPAHACELGIFTAVKTKSWMRREKERLSSKNFSGFSFSISSRTSKFQNKSQEKKGWYSFFLIHKNSGRAQSRLIAVVYYLRLNKKPYHYLMNNLQ